MARTSRRQHEAFLAYLADDMNRPDRGDHYLMAVTAVLQCLPAWVWGKEATPDVNACRLEFGRAGEDGGGVGRRDPVVPAEIPEEDLPPTWRGLKLPKRVNAEEIGEAEKKRWDRRIRKRAEQNRAAGRGPAPRQPSPAPAAPEGGDGMNVEWRV